MSCMNFELRIENFDIYDLRFFLCVLNAFVAQTTVLIGVNLCLKNTNLKKQSQFWDGQN